jgi:hypothetical protein
LAWFDEVTGEPLLTHVYTREEAFAGNQVERAPDLTLEPRGGASISILNAERPHKRRADILGTHRRMGVFAARGPGIRNNGSVGPLSILDVMPCLLYSLGLDVPADLEGRVPTEIFEPDLLEARPPRLCEPTVAVHCPERGPTLDPRSEREMLTLMRALKYV